ncbi:MAG TPA: hypothetical protein VNQ79_28595 [Blastocatellia bacterium]|nr:hypothetical protein [Blastocatellia bacterium]
MSDISFEKVLEEAMTLSHGEQRRLIDALDAAWPPKPRKTIEQLAAEQGKKPLRFEELRKPGEFFPEDESIDNLVNFIRESRRDTQERRISSSRNRSLISA